MVIEIDGCTLHCEMAGEGEPLLWLHGFMGAGADWRHIFDEPPAGYRLIAPDMRGHGASTNPGNSFSFRQAARDVLVVLDHLKIDRVQAIGLSGGGIALLHMATLARDRMASMVLVSAPPYFPEQARALQRVMSESMFSANEMALMRSRHRHGDRQIELLFEHARAFANSYDDVNFTPPYLSMIKANTLIVFGDRDPFYPVSLALELRAAIPHSYLWVVPNGGHGPVFGDAAAGFRATAMSFLNGEWEARSR